MAPEKAKRAESNCHQKGETPPNLTDEDLLTPSSTKRNDAASSRELPDGKVITSGTLVNETHDKDDTPSNLPPSSSTTTTTATTKHPTVWRVLLRALLLDLPLVTLFALYISMILLHHTYDQYLVPQAQLMRWTNGRKTAEMTYYDRSCTSEDISTNDTNDLIITTNHTPAQCMHHMAKHGVSLYPSILREETADELREWILQRNQIDQEFYVISGEHRLTIRMEVNTAPIVSKALREISEHPVFQPAIEEICGRNPAVIEFSPITSEYGAGDQFWHKDTSPRGSSFKHARTFLPSYSLFIPLQDTYPETGATEICPGSHVCNGEKQFCVDGGLYATGEDGAWPKATGALANQHLHHRGTAHTDPEGPDRVLLILTLASRPQMEKEQVETRMLSMGSADSLHWRQWGHTLDDFGNAPTVMKEPWRTLKSLGLYKPQDSDWGWDLPTVALMRIVNGGAGGYYSEDLEEWLDQGGFSFIPASLQAEFDEEASWLGFLEETLKNCQRASQSVYFLASGFYLILFVSLSIYQKLNGKGSRRSPFLNAVVRILVTHALVAVLAYYIVCSVASTPWAKNIRHGRAYAISITPSVNTEPGTLPNKRDVLATTKYNSKYLAGTSYVIEDAHPGNVNFNEIVAANSVGYEGLSPMLKRQLIADVADWVGQDMGRFLIQNKQGNWVVMPIPAAQKFIHKNLFKTSDPVAANVLTELGYLFSETEYGVLRDMAIHRKHVSKMLLVLQEKVLEHPSLVFGRSIKADVTTAPSSKGSSLRGLRSTLPNVPTLRADVTPVLRKSLLPIFTIYEPYPGAWSEEGDIVEAKYNGVYNEWYRATIVSLNVDASTYDVEYDDGEVDYDLCRLCIRPYESLQVGEEVGVRQEGGSVFYSGIVVAVHADDTVDIDTGESGLFENVSPGDTQRSDSELETEDG